MRRRSGIPSSYTEAAGKNMAARYHNTSEENYEAAAAAGSVRIPVGAAKTYTGSQGTPVSKKSAKGDVQLGAKVNRTNIENIGASYRIQPNVSATVVDPAVGPTMANGRVVPSVQGRVAPNFESGMQASSL
jgi:hypothetical protein